MIKKRLFTGILFATVFTAYAQISIDFESVPLINEINNGSDHSGGYESNGIFFKNYYDDQFASWGGFGASSKVDSVNGVYANQYSCYAGQGGNGSQKFAIAYYYEPVVLKKTSAQIVKLQSFQFTNSTWAGKVLKNGDAISKKFGGPTGNDPDYFKIRVFNHLGGQITDSADVFLADYRFGDNTQDYIVKDWRQVDFSFNNPFDSISFKLESTDVGSFGMNTPAYFCIDNLQVSSQTSVQDALSKTTHVYPNPFENELFIENSEDGNAIQIFDLTGREVQCESQTENGTVRIDTRNLKPGTYVIQSPARKSKLVVRY